ncbi:Transcriptional repressor MprA [Pseudodesulfovibrio hydrargyri]|uniref:Transcriptional repressor MprA n=1 Tax=Pseudodesulfovibrio hydrargyri TaxID=2125990 RepID=A0A1J5MWX3_9BACT|nr:MarR family transcriptional regulator [Pseudodesulfovibrio hydrargyri]OIQ50458.1 Transcriptional repressor MprA [Pseudodesulfovibrio hydrargyri]
MFFLKELPTRETLERYHKRFPGMRPEVIEEALHLMKKGSLLIRRLDEYFTGQGLSQLRYLILVVIDRQPDRDEMTVTELAANLDVSKPVMTRTLKGLIEDGYIDIAVHDKDRRVKLVRLTDKARAKLAAILPGYYETIQAAMEQLEADRA